jgi:hypothetical protein
MPILTDQPIPGIKAEVSAKIPEWLFEHKQLGYQSVNGDIIIYKLPTVDDCILYHTSAAHNPIAASNFFLKRMCLTALPKHIRAGVMGRLVDTILEECLPQDNPEEKILSDVAKSKEAYGIILMKVLDLHIKRIWPDKTILDMTYPELIEKLAAKEIITGEDIVQRRKGSRAARQVRRQTETGRIPQPTEV